MANRPNRTHKDRNLSQYGLFDVPTDLNNVDSDNDSDLEAELAALTGGSTQKPNQKSKPKPIPDSQLNAMVADSMRDIPSDEELSGDEDDPDLLNELSQIAGEDDGEEEVDEKKPKVDEDLDDSGAGSKSANELVDLLEERIKMYEKAESNAKLAGESSKVRRFNRGLGTLKTLLKQVQSGKQINEEDIPPVISTGAPKVNPEPSTLPIRPAPEIPSPQPEIPQDVLTSPEPVPEISIDTELLQKLNARKNEYKIVALKYKKSGDNQTAINFIKIAKQFDLVIKAVESGQPVDLSRMPGPPEEPQPQTTTSATQKQTEDPPEPTLRPAAAAATAPPTAASLEEALQQRLELYQKQVEAAKEQGNSSKVRRMGRIVKQFEDAIKLQKAGKTVPLDELPNPPGFPPLVLKSEEPEAKEPSPSGSNDPPAAPERQTPKRSDGGSVRISGNHVPNSRAEKQVILLLARQKEFKLAALAAKQKGEIQQAKELLRTAKGFDPLLEAARGGMPVDLATLPLPPSAKSHLDEDYEIVLKDDDNATDASNKESGDKDPGDHDILTRLEAQLTKQLRMCLSTRDHYKLLGDVASTNRFEHIALDVTKDLDVVRLARRSPGHAIPKFHFESKDFSIVKSFTDLGDNDLELNIIRGVNYMTNNPKEIDTYVRFEFPFPQDEPYKNKTSTIYDTNNPEYNASFKIPIQRSSRQCLRVFKRHSVKAEVYSKGGLFRGDTLLGTATIKLQPLETQCELHDSFDLMEGRKKVGGKLEVRIRVRHPMITKEIEQVHEKWLVVDH